VRRPGRSGQAGEGDTTGVVTRSTPDRDVGPNALGGDRLDGYRHSPERRAAPGHGVGAHDGHLVALDAECRQVLDDRFRTGGMPMSGLDQPEITVEQMIAGFKQIVARAHEKGIKVIGAPISVLIT